MLSVLDTTLLEWIRDYAVRAYTTPDRVVGLSYLNYARIVQTTQSFAL